MATRRTRIPLYGEHFAVSDVPPGTFVMGTEIEGKKVFRHGDGRGGEADLGGVQAVRLSDASTASRHPERSEGPSLLIRNLAE